MDFIWIFCAKTVNSHLPLCENVKEGINTIIIDPRFKAVLLMGLEVNVLCNGNCSFIDGSLDIEPEIQNTESEEIKWEKHLSENKSLSKELKRYFKECAVSRKRNLFTWWQESKIYFAQLTPLSQHYLWIPATQLVSERLINSAGNAISLRRENLVEEHVEELVFLHGRSSGSLGIYMVLVFLFSDCYM